MDRRFRTLTSIMCVCACVCVCVCLSYAQKMKICILHAWKLFGLTSLFLPFCLKVCLLFGSSLKTHILFFFFVCLFLNCFCLSGCIFDIILLILFLLDKHLCYYENDVLLICYILNARVVNLFHNQGWNHWEIN